MALHRIIGNYLNISANVLYLFDGIITIRQEVHVIWSRKWTVMSWLYALTRYNAAVNSILFLVPVTSLVSCKMGQYLSTAVMLMQFLCFALFSALRVYALSDGRYLTAVIVFALNLVPVATNLFICTITLIVEDSDVCTSIPALSVKTQFLLTLTTRIAVILGDVLVLAVTWMKTAYVYKEALQLNLWAPYATILFRDGTIYFIGLLTLNVLDVLEFSIPTLWTLDIVQPFFIILPPMVVCHFILNLRQIKSSGGSSISGDQAARLQSFIGNIGQPLRTEAEEMDEDGDNEDPADVGGTHFSATDRVPIRESLDTTIGMRHGMGNPGLQSLTSSGCAV
ncbi:hypothetical protein BC629DRAFT_1463743 [Irpex lacteus]|nr:hypothetical protein BC629DRAFT_1463743 [Irpex lacteus]